MTHLHLVPDLEAPPRPTLRSTLDLLTATDGAAETDLVDLLRLAVDDHEPTADKPPTCPSCDVAMPCDVWTYAAWESRNQLLDDVRARTRAIHARIDDLVARGVLREGPRP